MVQKRRTKAINKLCVRDLSLVCGAYFFEFCGWKQRRYAWALPFSRVPSGGKFVSYRIIHLPLSCVLLVCLPVTKLLY